MPEIEATDQNFDQEIIKHQGVALVDFWAPWCAPCKIQSPIIEHIARENQNPNLKIAAMNVDQHQRTAQTYGILSIPTLKIFKNGAVVDEMIGLQSRETIEAKLKEHVK